jgi:HlyD family secretion protein
MSRSLTAPQTAATDHQIGHSTGARLAGGLGLILLVAGCGADAPPTYSGYAEADLVYLASSGAGVLQDLRVERGQHVAQGAALFLLDTTPEGYSRQAALAQQHKADAQLADLGKGRRPEEIKAIEAQRSQAKAALSASTAQLQRQRELVRQGFVTAAQLDELEAAQARDAARVREVQAQLALARDAARSDAISAAKAEVQAARAQVSQTNWAQSQKQRSAPVDATVFDVLFRPGEWVANGAPVVVLLPDHAVKVRFFVPQAALSQIKVGGMVKYECDGCTAGQAKVHHVAPQAEFTPPLIYSNESKGKLVFMVEATPQAPQAEQLKPGQPLKVSLAS